MGALRSKAKVLASLSLALLALTPLSASANPTYPFYETGRQAIVFSMICLYIVLVEGAIIKLLLFGLNGPTWPKAFLLAAILNVLSAVVGIIARVYFDLRTFEFQPNLLAVFGISLGVEGAVLLFIYAWRKPRSALITAMVMNLASYLILIIARFPGGLEPTY